MAWLANLSRPLTLRSGRVLNTLSDARDVLTSDIFAGVTHSPPLEHAIELLLQAGTSGETETIKAATDQVAIVLRQRRLME